MRVTDIDVTESARGARLTATVVWERAPHTVDRLEFAFRGVPASQITTPGDALTAAVLIPAMATGEDVVVEAPVSARLLANTREIARIWTGWRPEWHPSTVDAPTADRAEPAPTEIAACFSGGVDSFYTVLCPREEPVTMLLSLHGWVIQEHLVPHLDALMAELRAAAHRLGLPHVVVETNAMHWGLRYAPWSLFTGTLHSGAVLACMALAMGSLVRRCLIGSDDIGPRPWGTHPLVDPLWSTEALEVVYDAPEIAKAEKAKLVARSDVALDTLEVCNGRRDDFTNCRRCSKCVATAYMLHLAGVLDRCRTLGPISPDIIRRTAIGALHHRMWRDLLAETKDPEYRRAITHALRMARARRLLRPVRAALQRTGRTGG